MRGLHGAESMRHPRGCMLQAQLVTAVATLLDNSPSKPGQAPSLADTYLSIDPKAEAGKGSSEPANPSSRDAMVFMVGGGNYMERERLAQWAQQSVPKKRVVYGSTELLSGDEFATQLADLGSKSSATN